MAVCQLAGYKNSEESATEADEDAQGELMKKQMVISKT
jgi:hypothetical protein